MAPRGHVHFHPHGSAYCDDFSREDLQRQGLLIHELVHVWQSQTRGKWYLVFCRMPWAQYGYSLKPGRPLTSYGIEQQAEIVKHAFWLRNGGRIAGAPDKTAYDLLVNFPGTE
ncbi:MAG: vgr related protein [Erythrobacter sp.]